MMGAIDDFRKDLTDEDFKKAVLNQRPEPDPAQEYDIWVKSLKDDDLEDEFQARKVESNRVEFYQEHEGHSPYKLQAVSAERNLRQKSGRYLENEY